VLAKTAESVAAKISAPTAAAAGRIGSGTYARLQEFSSGDAPVPQPYSSLPSFSASSAPQAPHCVAQYLADRALCEAYPALDLLKRCAFEPTEPLDFNRAAPPLFLVLEKLAERVGTTPS
jgi:hypothetical protein